jgi:Ala-tRNA(Pro) deacylase
MAIAKTLENYLHQQGIDFEIVNHPRTVSSMKTAESAHIPGSQLAKTVVLEDDKGYVMVVLPATHYVKLRTLNEQLHRDLRFAREEELSDLFTDCDLGAIPPVGQAYGIETWVDDSLTTQPDVYVEAGDHQELLRLSATRFQTMMASAHHGHFSQHL